MALFAKTGYNASIMETPTHHSSAPWYTKPVMLIIFGIVLLASITAGLLVRQHRSGKQSTAVNSSVKLYYNDGKTLLWQSGQDQGKNSGFISFVDGQLKKKYGADYQNQGEWRVTTTLDPQLQKVAEDQLSANADAMQRQNLKTSAFVAQTVGTGQVVSWVDNTLGEPKTTVQAKTMLGSLQIPFTYAAFMSKTGLALDATLEDVQKALPGYPCTNRDLKNGGNCMYNFDQRYMGPIPARQALAGARWVPTARAVVQTDAMTQNSGTPKITLDMTKKLGADAACYVDEALTKTTACYLAAALGDGYFSTPLAMTRAYATLANKGTKLEQTTMTEVSLNGKVRQAWKQSAGASVVSPEIAQSLTGALSDAGQSYITRKDAFVTPKGEPLATVGGFNNDGTLTSAVQYSDKYVAGFWGTLAPNSMQGSSMQQVALPVTSGWFNQASKLSLPAL
jgi:membrane peptidoglycan carboxypeptidase